MDSLHAPWRIQYILAPKPPPSDTSLFTRIAQDSDDVAHNIIARRRTCFAVLNNYPYNGGHLMVVPYKQVADFDALTDDETLDLMKLTRECLAALRRVMKPDTTLVPAGIRPGGRWLGPLPHLLSVFVSRLFASQKVIFFVAKISTEDLNVITSFVEAGKVTPSIDRSYPFAEVPAAIQYVKEGHARAKVVVTVS